MPGDGSAANPFLIKPDRFVDPFPFKKDSQRFLERSQSFIYGGKFTKLLSNSRYVAFLESPPPIAYEALSPS